MCFPDEITEGAQSSQLPIREVVGDTSETHSAALAHYHRMFRAARFIWRIDRALHIAATSFVLCARREVDASHAAQRRPSPSTGRRCARHRSPRGHRPEMREIADETFESRALALALSSVTGGPSFPCPISKRTRLRRWARQQGGPRLPYPSSCRARNCAQGASPIGRRGSGM